MPLDKRVGNKKIELDPLEFFPLGKFCQYNCGRDGAGPKHIIEYTCKLGNLEKIETQRQICASTCSAYHYARYLGAVKPLSP